MSDEGNFGMTSLPTPWGLAIIILVALGILAVIRHLFGSIRVSAGATA